MALYLVHGRKPAELPTTWADAEGRTVLWSDWRPPLLTFICPPPPQPEVCQGCGQLTVCETSAGRIMPRSGETVLVEEIVPSKRVPGRTYGRWVRRPVSPYIRLIAFRCVTCGHVEIFDEYELHPPQR